MVTAAVCGDKLTHSLFLGDLRDIGTDPVPESIPESAVPLPIGTAGRFGSTGVPQDFILRHEVGTILSKHLHRSLVSGLVRLFDGA